MPFINVNLGLYLEINFYLTRNNSILYFEGRIHSFTIFIAVNIVYYFCFSYFCAIVRESNSSTPIIDNIMSTSVQTKSKVKSTKRKSERLGWKSLTDRDTRPLSERIGEGRRIYADTRKSSFVLIP